MLDLTTRRLACAAAWMALLASAPRPVSAQLLGPEFQVNSFTTARQYRSAVAADGSGSFVVAWSSYGQDAATSVGVFAQRFGPTGNPLGGEFQVNSYSTGTQWRPAVAAGPLGGFLVVWSSGAQDGSDEGIFAQRFGPTGNPAGGEFRVNSYTTGIQYTPAVAADGAGNFIVVWTSYAQDGSDHGVFGQRLDSSGVPVGGEFKVNSYTTGRQNNPMVAAQGSGGFVVIWQNYSYDGSQDEIVGQRFNSAGAPAGSEFHVNTYTTGYQTYPAVAMEEAGKFLVVWSSWEQDGSTDGVFGQRYAANGAPAGGEFQANQYTLGSQESPAIAADASGNFLVTWDSFEDPESLAILGRRFTAAGFPAGNEFHVNTYTTYGQARPAVAADSAGNFVVVWDSNLQDGSDYGVFGQKLRALVFADGFGIGTVCGWSAAAGSGGSCP